MFRLDHSVLQGPAKSMRRRFTLTRVLVIVASITLLDVASGGAQNDDNAALRNEVGEMRRTIDSLNSKVHELEQKLADHPQPTPQTEPAPHAADASATVAADRRDARERWSEVKRGMPKTEVEDLLGQPNRTMNVSTRTVWYYQYSNSGSGSVVFADDGSVIDWQTPPFGTWWW